MKYFIVSDIEGVCGVLDAPEWIYENSKYKENANRLSTNELNAVISGIFAAEKANGNGEAKTEVVVCDGHGCGAIDPELLDERALYLNMRGLEYPFGLDSSFDAVMWVGQHAKSGTKFAHLAHTGSFSTLYTSVNGTETSEYIDVAYCAHELGVPVIFAGGDKAFAKEATELVPECVAVYTKWGLRKDDGKYLDAKAYETFNTPAIHLHPKKACALLKEGAYEAVDKLYKKGKAYFTMPSFPKPPYVWNYRERGSSESDIYEKRSEDSIISLFNSQMKKTSHP
ncbi:MAG: M55 family metallopeptidase [Oscillospiraceae bacterium]|nr:M55 family metallopeptidase [Oscillospiraceae bacterium]